MLFVLCLAVLVTPVALAGDAFGVSLDPVQGTSPAVQGLPLDDAEALLAGTEDRRDASPDEDEAPAEEPASEEPSDAEPSSGGSEPSPGDEDGPVATLGGQVLSEADAARAQALAEAGVLSRFLGEQVKEVEKVRPDPLPTLIDLPSDEEAPAPSTAPKASTASPVPITAAAVVVSTAAAAGATMAFFWLTGSSATSAGSAYASSKGATAAGKKVAPIFSPLFTRFEGKKVLEHPNREALYTHIAGAPGVRLQDLCDATGLSRTAVTHHLRLLENQHLIMSKRVGRSRHYYENGGRYARDEKEAYAVLQNERSRAIADYIRAHPGAIQKHLCERLGVRPSIVHWHVKRLKEAQLVDAVRQGRTVSYYPADAMARLTL